MTFGADRLKQVSLLSLAAYIFVLALAAKGVFLYGSQHPPKEGLLVVRGVVKQVRLGGRGNSTRFRIESDGGTFRYSSYYGKVWPGMERIQPEERVQVLAERNKLNKNELLSGKQYYIWELIHDNQVIVAYDDVRELVEGKEAIANRYASGALAASAVFILIACIRKAFLNREE